MKYRSFLGFLTGESQNGCDHSVSDSKLYVSDVAEFRQRAENGVMSPDCNSFNAEYSKSGILEENSTGAEYGCRRCFSSRRGGSLRNVVCKLGKAKLRQAFTLAEVLITLSIIGVVASLTIPSLIVKNQEKEMIVQTKKAYNVFSNAINLAIADYGSPDNWGWICEFDPATGYPSGATSGVSSERVINMLSRYLNLQKNCGVKKGCFYQGIKHLNGPKVQYADDITGAAKGILSDGMNFHVISWSTDCNQNWGNSEALKRGCGTITVDINGAKGPNTLGLDIASFYITKSGFIPTGLPDETNNSLEKTCKNKNDNGLGCTAWILIKENMDFLRRDISWDK